MSINLTQRRKGAKQERKCAPHRVYLRVFASLRETSPSALGVNYA
jgi:hypothetical protein